MMQNTNINRAKLHESIAKLKGLKLKQTLKVVSRGVLYPPRLLKSKYQVSLKLCIGSRLSTF